MKKIRIGVLGVSNHLLKRIVLPLKNTSNCYIYGIASRDKYKALSFAKEFDIEKIYESYESLLKDPNIDVVYIPLPNHMHKEWIIKVAKAGKNILCEKPLCLNRDEVINCKEVMLESKVQVMEAFMYQFHPLWIQVQNIIRTNQIGAIQYIHTSFAYNNPNEKNIRNIKEFGGGALMDIGCYAVSVPRFLLQKEPQKVVSIMKEHPVFKTDMLSSAILDFGNTVSTFTVSTASENNQSVEIIGNAGRISIPSPFNTYVDTPSQITISTQQGTRVIDFPVCDQYGLMFESFSKAILENSNVPIPIDDSLRNLKVLDAIITSSKTKNWVELNSTTTE
jgi:predicted dehydrogenase